MDKENYLVAVASSDGIVVNCHFGRAEKFYIYKVSEEELVEFIEERMVTPVCEGGNHDGNKLRENLSRFSDCKYLMVSRIGNGAATLAEEMGIIPMELPGEICESINRLVTYQKIQNLFT